MGSAIISALAGVALKVFARQLIGTLFGFLQAEQQGRAREDLGASRVTATINRETADAEHRAAQAQAKVPSSRQLLDDLVAGKPF